MAQLVEAGLVSDRRYGAGRVRVRAGQGVGPLRIRAELHGKGLDGETIAAVLNEHDPAWNERARKARCKRFGEAVPPDWQERARQARFLRGRGFTMAQIGFAIEAPATSESEDGS